MEYLDFYKKLSLLNDKEYIENFLIYNASLVIAGVKPASTIALKKINKRLYDSWCSFGKSFIDKLNLYFIELRESNESIILMIYDKNLLHKSIDTEQNINFLINLGYNHEVEVNNYLNTLKHRYEKYHCPHELGIFLGIPFEDVKDFMECTSKRCLMCGYWKVYNNRRAAIEIFEKYDIVKQYTIDNMFKTTTPVELVFKIRDSFYLPLSTVS
jgi:hypothetical protein